MSRRSTALPLAALASFAILVAACGGSTATTAPATQGPATFDTSSFHADQQLEGLFPKQIGGEDLTVLSMTGDEFMDGEAAPEIEAALGTLGKSASDLSVGFGGIASLSIIAFKVSGVPGNTILAAVTAAFQQEDASTSSDVTISGKSVKKFAQADTTEDVLYVYTSHDVVFTVSGSDITDVLLNEVFSKLP
jgi:hypothetical protein